MNFYIKWFIFFTSTIININCSSDGRTLNPSSFRHEDVHITARSPQDQAGFNPNYNQQQQQQPYPNPNQNTQFLNQVPQPPNLPQPPNPYTPPQSPTMQSQLSQIPSGPQVSNTQSPSQPLNSVNPSSANPNPPPQYSLNPPPQYPLNPPPQYQQSPPPQYQQSPPPQYQQSPPPQYQQNVSPGSRPLEPAYMGHGNQPQLHQNQNYGTSPSPYGPSYNGQDQFIPNPYGYGPEASPYATSRFGNILPNQYNRNPVNQPYNALYGLPAEVINRLMQFDLSSYIPPWLYPQTGGSMLSDVTSKIPIGLGLMKDLMHSKFNFFNGLTHNIPILGHLVQGMSNAATGLMGAVDEIAGSGSNVVEVPRKYYAH